MRSSRARLRPLSLVLLLAAASPTFVGIDQCAGERAGPAVKGIDLPDQTNPLRVQIGPFKGDQRQKRPNNLFQVSIENTSTEALLICVDDWSAPAGLLLLEVFDATGRKLVPRESLDVDPAIHEDTNLKILEPGQHESGVMSISAVGRSYRLGKGTYFVIARYWCPFAGEREVSGRRLRISTGRQVSLPATVTVGR